MGIEHGLPLSLAFGVWVLVDLGQTHMALAQTVFNMDVEEKNALLYWLLGAWILTRYSGASTTVIAQDVAAIRSDQPIDGLYRNLGLLGQRLVVTDQMLAGRGVGSPFFLLSYLVARRNKACDWWFGVPVSTSDQVEYHHIHPRATLAALYSKAEINDLANLAFISTKANRKISARSPEKYFPEVGQEELSRHAVPPDRSLRIASAFREFARARRHLLAEGMTELLESFRPAFLASVSRGVADEHGGDVVSFTAYGTDADAPDVVLSVDIYSVSGDVWSATLMAAALQSVLDDLRDGRGTGISLAHERVDIDGDAEMVEIPMGPFLVSGSIDEWQRMMDRELDDLQPLGELPDITEPGVWKGERQSFPVIESE